MAEFMIARAPTPPSALCASASAHRPGRSGPHRLRRERAMGECQLGSRSRSAAVCAFYRRSGCCGTARCCSASTGMRAAVGLTDEAHADEGSMPLIYRGCTLPVRTAARQFDASADIRELRATDAASARATMMTAVGCRRNRLHRPGAGHPLSLSRNEPGMFLIDAGCHGMLFYSRWAAACAGSCVVDARVQAGVKRSRMWPSPPSRRYRRDDLDHDVAGRQVWHSSSQKPSALPSR